ncbi:GIY-YIG nuclease family protein [Bosea caraganae]|uniref:GIY-YIG nuclease family protein n=1 Tax=Bosea caraganae TaxID=2763117 RepID=A0A370LB81_9HYPH|nr:GIY-YIG nuclease family protein [Bosea caraganae]RDJ27216.1 GIY-YIG nuclease family protein [Bosea caraganae]RDJ29233.1 GIY-YIG nuclease family protein [Bosea caraganae]
MNREDRKAAVAAYKDRKAAVGIYAVRCSATDQQWAGSAPDLATIWNRLCFTLRQGVSPHRSLQDAWTEHGAERFAFDILERLDDEQLAHGRDRILRDRRAYWCATLPAEPI